MDNFFSKPKRRHVRELNVVPILDMMTTLIIFLLQITSFIEFTKITIPPSSTATITDPLRPPPVSPKIFLMRKSPGEALRVQMMWTGDRPGEKSAVIESAQLVSIEESGPIIFDTVKKLSEEFKNEFPAEKTIQLGASSNIPYQFVISTMDGIQDAFVKPVAPDANSQGTQEPANLVLVSYRDVDAEEAGSRSTPAAAPASGQKAEKKGGSI